MEHYNHYYQGKGYAALLHVEMLQEDQMNFKIQGDPVIVVKMITKAMQQKQDIAATMIAAVCQFADEAGIPRKEIGNMVKFHNP